MTVAMMADNSEEHQRVGMHGPQRCLSSAVNAMPNPCTAWNVQEMPDCCSAGLQHQCPAAVSHQSKITCSCCISSGECGGKDFLLPLLVLTLADRLLSLIVGLFFSLTKRLR